MKEKPRLTFIEVLIDGLWLHKTMKEGRDVRNFGGVFCFCSLFQPVLTF